MIKKAIFPAALLLIFAMGLFLPDLALVFSDRQSARPVNIETLAADDYAYAGTFDNRVRSFSAYENASVNVRMIEKTQPESVEKFPWALNELCPELGGGTINRFDFCLSPADMNARFAYTQYSGKFADGDVRIVADKETGKPILISITNAHKALSEWEKSMHWAAEGFFSAPGLDVYAVTKVYADILGYSSLNDLTDENSSGGSVLTAKTDVKGEKLQICITFSETAGILNYRLISLTGQ